MTAHQPVHGTNEKQATESFPRQTRRRVTWNNFRARLTRRAIVEVDPVDGEVGSRRTRRVPADVDRYREWLDVPADLHGFCLPPDGEIDKLAKYRSTVLLKLEIG